MASKSKDSDDELTSSQCDDLCKQFIQVTHSNSAEAIMYLQQNEWKLTQAIESYFNEEEKVEVKLDSKPVKSVSKESTSGSKEGSTDGAELTASQCDDLCKEFVEVTQTNSAEAIMHLQEHDWKLTQAIESFFNGGGAASAKPNSKPAESTSKEKSSSTMSNTDLKDPNKIRILSWNLDGLDDVSLIPRTKSVVQTVLKEDPDVIYLQEVVPASYDIIKELMSASYNLYPADTQGYFTVMLMKKQTVWIDRKETKPFYSSLMLRKLQIVHANIKGLDFKLMTSHLESTRDHAKERKRQLEICLSEMKSAAKNINILFGGDLNLTAADLKGFSFPDGVVDVWEATGSRKEAAYTWDMMRNDNKIMSGKSKPRCRFDRMYFKSSSVDNVSLKYFELIGLERVPNCSRFPSDHWGILCHLKVI